jgi:hypothetical protein
MDLKRLKQGLGIASLLLASSQAGAWGPMQHKMVALVAQDRLSPRTLQAVQDILGGDIGLDKIASTLKPGLRRLSSRATQPDWARASAEPRVPILRITPRFYHFGLRLEHFVFSNNCPPKRGQIVATPFI